MQSHVFILCIISFLFPACCLLWYTVVFGIEVIHLLVQKYYKAFLNLFYFTHMRRQFSGNSLPVSWVMVKYRNLTIHTLPPPRFEPSTSWHTVHCRANDLSFVLAVFLMVIHVAVLRSQIKSNILFTRLVHNRWPICCFLLWLPSLTNQYHFCLM